MRTLSKRGGWYGLVLGILLIHGAHIPAWAATLTVTSTADSGAGTLREAIVDAAPDDTIDFNLTPPATILLNLGGELVIDKNLTITGPGAGNLALDGNGGARVMLVTSGVTANVSGLTIRNGNTAGNGGGIYNDGTLTVSSSTLSGNNANLDGGGGIFNGGTLTVNSSTLSGNTSAGVVGGGGIFNSFGMVTVSNSTLSGNSASSGGGISNLSPATVSRTIIANSCEGFPLSSTGDNFDSDGTCFTASVLLNDRINLDPLLNALANNGGPTQTHALQGGSPAINEVRVNTATCSGTDQRGVARPIGPRCDIGAVESPDETPVELQEFVVE